MKLKESRRHAGYMQKIHAACIIRGNQDTCGIHADNTYGIWNNAGYMGIHMRVSGECTIIENSAPIRPPIEGHPSPPRCAEMGLLQHPPATFHSSSIFFLPPFVFLLVYRPV